MKTMILAVMLSTIFLAPTIGVGPTVYDGQFYNHTISIRNDHYQPLHDLHFTIQVGYDYFDYIPQHPELICTFYAGELCCVIDQPTYKIEAGPLVTILSHAQQAPVIIWAERNFDSLSLPKLLVIREFEQHNLFMPMVKK